MTLDAYFLAYLDPGTGSYILQMLIGAFLGLLLTVKLYWRKLRASVAGLLGRARRRADGE